MPSYVVNLFKLLLGVVGLAVMIRGLIVWWRVYDERRMLRNYGVTYAELLEKYRKL